MYDNKRIIAVIPCFNEAKQIEKVIETLPDFIDRIIIVDDKSLDNTLEIATNISKSNKKIVLLKREVNGGTGASRITGLKYFIDSKLGDIVVLLDGDGQMDPTEMYKLLVPVVNNEVDVTKGNRFLSGLAWGKIPKLRYLGNAVLSLLTKIASGYWHVADSQSGYFVINYKTICKLNLDKLYSKYGFPNDLIINLNIVSAKFRDISIKPIYNVGEKSTMKITKVIYKLPFLLIKRFFRRLIEKYIIRDFHPLVFFYAFGFLLSFISVPLFVRILYYWISFGYIPKVNFLSWMFASIMGMQFILFAMLFDMENNKDLK